MKRILLSLFILLTFLQIKASDTLTVRQVFNFNVGDTFDYRETHSNNCMNIYAQSYVRKVVISKSYNAGHDTLYYQYNVSGGGGWWPFSGNQFFNMNRFDTITNLDSFVIKPLLSPCAGCLSVNYDTTIYFGYASNSIDIRCFESGSFSRYTKRLGMTYCNSYGGGDPCGTSLLIESDTYELIHFANDSMHFGFDLIDGMVDLSRTPNIHLSPNPANGTLHLTLSDVSQSYQITLTDILGQEVYSSPITQSETTHDISKLSKGIYTWRISENNSIIKTGKLIKQ